MKKILAGLFFAIMSISLTGQNVNGVLIDATNSATRNQSAAFEINAITSTGPTVRGGFLMPRVALTGASDATTISGTEANGLMVYNDGTGGLTPAGFYYWQSGSWNLVATGSGSNLFSAGTGLSWSGTNLNSVWTVNGTDIYNNNTGNVGINETTPQGQLEVAGDIWSTLSGDNSLRIRPGLVSGNQYGFADQHNNLMAFVNEQGTTNQAFVLGDVDATGAATLFGVSVATGGSNPTTGAEAGWAKRFEVSGSGTIKLNTYTANGLLKTTAGDGTLAIATGADIPSGSDFYIRNQTSVQTGADFNIDGSGVIAEDLTVGTLYGLYKMNGRLGSFDTRSTNPNPEIYRMGVVSEFKANSSNGLSDGGTYNSVLSIRQWSGGTDWSGGGVHQIGFTQNGNLWHRYSQTTGAWGAWKKYLSTADLSGTADYLARWTSTTTLGTGATRDDGTNVGIGVAPGIKQLTVNNDVLVGSTYVTPSGSIFSDASKAQLILGGAHNAEFNIGTNVAKLLITGHDNDNGTAVYPIFVEDENGLDDFWILNRQSSGGDPTMFFAGNMGIKNTNPSSELHIGNNTDGITSSKTITVESEGYAGIRLFGDTDGSSGEPGGGYVLVSQDNEGVQGIFGTVNIAGEDGSGNTFTGTIGNSVVLGNKYAGPLHLGTSNSVQMTIEGGGNVGVGTTAPTQALDINGQIRIRGGSPEQGDVLTASNSNGDATWEKPGRGEYFAGTVVAGNWYRIAQNGNGSPTTSGNRANAEFTLRDFISGGGHSTITFRIGISYNDAANMSFTVLNHSKYSTATFTQVRILEYGTYATQYLEVYANRSGSVDFSIVDNNQSSGWTPVDWTAGSIPTSYTARVFDVDKLFVVGDYDDRFTILRGGNVGIGVTNPAAKLQVNGNIVTSAINETSDRRFKKEVTNITDALKKVTAIRGVNYQWKTNEFPERSFEDGVQYGLIAQELEEIVPELVTTDREGWKSIEYSHLVPLLIEAIKEMNNINLKLEKRVDELEIWKSEITNLIKKESQGFHYVNSGK